MGEPSRSKGRRGELEVARVFRAAGFDVDRTPNSGGLRLKGDLYGANLPVHIETKRRERLDVWAGMQQAESEANGRVPWLAFRRNRSPWYVAMLLEDALALLNGALRDVVAARQQPGLGGEE